MKADVGLEGERPIVTLERDEAKKTYFFFGKAGCFMQAALISSHALFIFCDTPLFQNNLPQKNRSIAKQLIIVLLLANGFLLATSLLYSRLFDWDLTDALYFVAESTATLGKSAPHNILPEVSIDKCLEITSLYTFGPTFPSSTSQFYDTGLSHLSLVKPLELKSFSSCQPQPNLVTISPLAKQ